ncbi:MAG: zinc-ribbon domain-containing protein [Clostridia bacterium]|nr:zinc-ribbon domain-containing protein [Clostridia bacterium]
MEWIYFVGLIVIVAIVMAIVGFLGNKVVDGAENAFRSKRIQNRKQDPSGQPKTESLAARYAQPQSKSNQTVLPSQAQNEQGSPTAGKYCSNCGQMLREESVFCPYCGERR